MYFYSSVPAMVVISPEVSTVPVLSTRYLRNTLTTITSALARMSNVVGGKKSRSLDNGDELITFYIQDVKGQLDSDIIIFRKKKSTFLAIIQRTKGEIRLHRFSLLLASRCVRGIHVLEFIASVQQHPYYTMLILLYKHYYIMLILLYKHCSPLVLSLR